MSDFFTVIGQLVIVMALSALASWGAHSYVNYMGDKYDKISCYDLKSYRERAGYEISWSRLQEIKQDAKLYRCQRWSEFDELR